MTWLKMFFWISWEELQDAGNLEALLQSIQEETGLVVRGVASSASTVGTTHPSFPLLHSWFHQLNRPILWLHMPGDIKEEPVLYESKDYTVLSVSFQMQDLPLGYVWIFFY